VIDVSFEEFERLTARAIDALPPAFARLLDNIVVVVEEEPTAEQMESVGLDPGEYDLLGLYEGISLDQRGFEYSALPDRVVLFRLPILWACKSEREVESEIRDTLIHELGHHFGLDDDEMPY
jgi:predicted Zn-dependent protease with MMP-like domain